MLNVLAQVPSDTWYTKSPEWGWLIVAYFFLGGIAGGAAFLAGMLQLFGDRRDRSMTMTGYLVALVAIVVSGPLLIVDLTRPERFWHMLWKSDTGGPLLKWYSPISLGVWVISLFAAAVFLAALGALAEAGMLPGGLRGLAALGEGALGKLIAAAAALLGLFLAGYTGALLAATNRPLWGDTTLISLLFLLSGVSAGAATMLLLGWGRTSEASVAWVDRMDNYSILLELIVLVVLAVSLGSLMVPLWGNAWGVVLVIGVVLLGALLPLLLRWRPRLLGPMTIPSAAVLVILGSLLLRAVVVLSSEAV